MKAVLYSERNRLDAWMTVLALVYTGCASIVGEGMGADYYFPYLYIGTPIFAVFFLGRFIGKARKGTIYWGYLLLLIAILIWWGYRLAHPDIWFLR